MLLAVVSLRADDWPQWRGSGGEGNWNPSGFPGRIEEDKTRVLWKKRIGGGYSGVTVAQNRVLVMDYRKQPNETERVLCLDGDSGEPLWEHSYNVAYKGLDYGSGPRAAVTIEGDRAWSLGAVGHVHCFDVRTGDVVWTVDTVGELQAQRPTWGFAASPVIWNDVAIVQVAAQPGGCFVALNKRTGKEVWRGGDDPAGYCTPFLIKRNDKQQFLCWTPEHVLGLNPTNGHIAWRIPYKVKYGVSIAGPLFVDGIAVVCGYWHGSRAIRLKDDLSAAELLWSDEENLCGLMSQPLHKNGYVYLLDKGNGIRCFELKTGKILWSDRHQVTPKDRNPQASLVWANKDKNLAAALNANGELLVVEVTPEGLSEKSRMQLLGKTWAHPAYAGNRVFARSDREIIALELWPERGEP